MIGGQAPPAIDIHMSWADNKVMRTTIRMNQELAQKVRRLADDSGRTFTAVIEEAVADLLAKQVNHPPRNRPPLPVVGDPTRRVTEDEYRAIIERMLGDDDARHLGGGRDPS